MTGDVRGAIAEGGGLFTLADLARRWDISMSRIGQLAAHRDFPEPILTGDDGRGKRLYVGEEADAFRAVSRGNARRRNT